MGVGEEIVWVERVWEVEDLGGKVGRERGFEKVWSEGREWGV